MLPLFQNILSLVQCIFLPINMINVCSIPNNTEESLRGAKRFFNEQFDRHS